MTPHPARVACDVGSRRSFEDGPITPNVASAGALIAATADDCHDGTASASRRRLAQLRKALREERRRGTAGHWSYDLNRHIALAEQHKAELSRLKAIAGTTCRRSLRDPRQPRAKASRSGSAAAAAAAAGCGGAR